MMSPVPHSRTVLDHADIDAALFVLRSGQVNESANTRSLEELLRGALKRDYAWAAASGTAALYSALLAMNIGPGDEVLVPTYVCDDVLSAVRWTGAEPVPVDLDYEDLNPDPNDALKRLTLRTRAIVLAHVLGHPARIHAFAALGLPVIEDCAHGIGARVGNQPAGSLGHATILSFHGLKMLTGGEGGMVLTDDQAMANRYQGFRQPDYAAGGWKLHSRLPNVVAAIVASQWTRFDQTLERRRALASRYSQAALEWTRARPVATASPDGRYSSAYRFAVVADATMNYEDVAARFETHGVIVRRPVKNLCHRALGLRPSDYPAAESVFDRIVSLPLYPDLSDEECDRVLLAGQRVFA